MFDYYIDHDTKQFTPWTEKIPKFELDSDVPLQVKLRKNRWTYSLLKHYFGLWKYLLELKCIMLFIGCPGTNSGNHKSQILPRFADEEQAPCDVSRKRWFWKNRAGQRKVARVIIILFWYESRKDVTAEMATNREVWKKKMRSPKSRRMMKIFFLFLHKIRGMWILLFILRLRIFPSLFRRMSVENCVTW